MVAESWEVSGHPAGVSVVDSGALAGRNLPGLTAEFGERLVGRRAQRADGGASFPLLVKLLDASHALSVQVHPDDEMARRHALGEPGKTEMWHVLHARAGARIIHGLERGVDREALRRAVEANRVQDVLRKVEVRAGDSIMVPAGTVHGILSGLVLVEIQQCADTTYRIHDWGRAGPDGRPRELHLDRAMEAVRFGEAGGAADAPVTPRVVRDRGGVRREVVADCAHFVVERVTIEAGTRLEAALDGETFEIWGVLAGEAVVEHAQGALAVEAVRFALLPAAMGAFAVRAGAEAVTALRAYLPGAT